MARAREPDASGFATQDGVRSYFEVFGDGPTTILLMPTFPVVDGRQWKAQVPYLARHFRVVTFDPRGNGRSDRPAEVEAYGDEVYARDAAAVLDATRTETAFLVALCSGIKWSLLLATAQPDRVRGLVAIAPGVHPLAPPLDLPLDPVDAERWRGDYPGWVDYHSAALLPEPHSSKAFDDMVAWSLQTDAATLSARGHAPLRPADEDDAVTLSEALSCPVLVLHGTEDRCQPIARGRRFAELTGGEFVELPGSGHLPHARDPVAVNVLIKGFVDQHTKPVRRRSPWLFARDRQATGSVDLFADRSGSRPARPDHRSGPARTDAGPGDPLVVAAPGDGCPRGGRRDRPPGERRTRLGIGALGERVGSGHDLHAFNAFRRMDEIFCANYMLFDDVVRETPYDAVDR